MSYVIRGLDPRPFQPLFGQADKALRGQGVVRYRVDAPLGYPCRVSLADAPEGSSVLLVNYVHQPADTPYHASHAIFVREGAAESAEYRDEVPAMLSLRPFISLRAFDEVGMMVDAELAPGSGLDPAIRRLLDLPGARYLHAHFAARGCFAACIEPA